MRLTHEEVVRFCNAHAMDPDGFPLALANFCYNLGMLDSAAIDQEAAEKKHALLTVQAHWTVKARGALIRDPE